MPQINDIRELAQQNARYVSNSPQDWMSYLDVAARLYRYSFTDTLLIHAQRPDATACAEMELWNQKMKEYLDITPANDAEGILQDMHWSDGSFGYFPSYLLGSIYDGMYLEELEKELGPVDEILKEGRIKEITKWLNEKIHWYGSTRTPKEVIANVCGKEVSAEPLVRYFEKKYASVYDLK